MKDLFVLGFVLLVGSVVYPSLATAKALPDSQCCTYGYEQYGYHPTTADISNKARTSMDAILTAAHGLAKIKDEIGSEQANLESNLKAARKMTKLINSKIDGAVRETMKILEDATTKAKAKLMSVKEAASALGTVEDNIEGKNTAQKDQKVHSKHKKTKAKHGRMFIPVNPSEHTVEAVRKDIEEGTKRSQVALRKTEEFLGKVDESLALLRKEAHAIKVQL